MRRFGPLLVLAVLAAALLAIAAFPTEPEAGGGGRESDVYFPVGYVAEVERMIRDGRLRYQCESGTIEPVDLAPAEQTFFDHSYLRDDVEAWNGGDRRPFVVERSVGRDGRCEGRLTGVNASFHRQRLPGYVAETWRGSLFLQPAARGTTLTSGERTLEVAPVPWELLPFDASAYEDAWLTPGAEGVRSQRLALKMIERGRPFGTLKYVGDQAVLEIQGERPAASLDGCELDLGWRVRLDEGDMLRLHEPGRLDERFRVDTGRQAALASFLTRVNGEPRRRNFPERLAMAPEVARAVDAAVDAARAQAPDAVRDDFDVYLTLDPFLDQRLASGLAQVARERWGGRPARAAVTVMDAGSGRLLALPSYPREADLERLFGEEEEATTRRELLGRNHNFLQHGVGSAAKPFLAAAALAVHPQLAGLEVHCFAGGEPDELLGYEMGRYHLPADCYGEDPWIGLEEFLTVSSNRYMLYLGLLAMADWGGGAPLAAPGTPALDPAAAYRLGGRTFAERPRLPIVREDDRPGDGLTELQEVDQLSDFPAALRRLFGREVRFRQESTVGALDLDLWAPVLRAAYGRAPGEGAPPRPDAVIAFAPVTPEEVNLRFNLVQQLRQDLYTLLLGNGNNRWSNVQLAEAMARLATGRRVEAHLVERLAVPAERAAGGQPEMLWDLDTAAPPAALGLPEALRGRLVAGMRGVVESPRGTARELGAAVAAINRRAPAGVTYSVVAKTGTPTLSPAVVRAGPSEMGPDALGDFGGNPQVRSGALVLALRREKAGEPAEELAMAVYVEAQGGSAEAVAAAAALLAPLVESQWPEDWLQAAAGRP